MLIYRTICPVSYQYGIDRCHRCKDFGVFLDAKLSFVQHVEIIRSKALKSSGFIIRNCQDFADVNVVTVLYYVYIRGTFLFGLLHGSINCIDLIGKINFCVPRINSLGRQVFYIDGCRFNAAALSPVNVMCPNLNLVLHLRDIHADQCSSRISLACGCIGVIVEL